MGEEVCRPVRCPCCGADRDQDFNDRRRYRIVRYACGASAWCCEDLATDPLTLRDYVDFDSPLEWDRACPSAMVKIERHNRLRGQMVFDLGPEVAEP